jgi:hypothetical protein
MERPTKEELEEVRNGVADCCDIRWKAAGKLLAEIDALTAEQNEGYPGIAHAFLALQQVIEELRRDLALSELREQSALRQGFDAGQALDEHGNPKFPFWENYETHLADLQEHAARVIRIAEAEEKESE